MKKMIKNCTYFFVAAMLLVPALSHAQDRDSRIGIKAGVNLSNLYSSDVDANNARVGFNAGIFTEIAVSDAFSIQPELLYYTKGNKMTYGNNGGVADVVGAEGDVKFNLNYIELPILARISIADVISIHIGPYISYLLGANVDADGTFSASPNDISKDQFNTIDYGVAAGVGVDLGGFSLGVRYDLGLNKVANQGNNISSLGSNLLLQNSKNSAIQLYAAIGF